MATVTIAAQGLDIPGSGHSALAKEGTPTLLEEIVVGDSRELLTAVANAFPGTMVVMEDGIYDDVSLDIAAKGSPQRPVIITARSPGHVFFTGDTRVVISGDYITLRGIYFRDGARKPSEWRTHGPGLVAIYGDHNRITECAFHNFDEVDSPWITTHVVNGKPAMYNRIDHNSFTEKVTLDQVINLNNSESKNELGRPMYNRVDHNYFSNPPKKGNAGGAIRVGYFLHDMGRCLIDNNLFERQDSEPEIITSKSRENVYLHNTIRNSQGTLNFRHGSDQVAIGNFFLGDDTLYGYGGMFIWGENHTIASNYFSLPRTLNQRGNAAIYLNPGHPESEHSLAAGVLIAHNVFAANNGYAIHFHALLERRQQTAASQKMGPPQIPHSTVLVNNVFLGGGRLHPLFRNDFASLTGDIWRGNTYVNARIGIDVASGLTAANMSFSVGEDGIYRPLGELYVIPEERHVRVTTSDEMKQAFKDVFDIDLDLLANQSVYLRKPAAFRDVGPFWLKKSPSSYAERGVMSEVLKASMERVEARRK